MTFLWLICLRSDISNRFGRHADKIGALGKSRGVARGEREFDRKNLTAVLSVA